MQVFGESRIVRLTKVSYLCTMKLKVELWYKARNKQASSLSSPK